MKRWVEERNAVSSKMPDSRASAPFSWDCPCLTNNTVGSNTSLKILSNVILAAGLNSGGPAFVPPAVAMQTPLGYTPINQAAGTGLKSENLLLCSSHTQNFPAPQRIHMYCVCTSVVSRNREPLCR